MDVVVRGTVPGQVTGRALALPMFQGESAPGVAVRGLARPVRQVLDALLASGDFNAQPLEIALLHAPGAAGRVLVAGLGERRAATPAHLRQFAAQVARRAADLDARALALLLPAIDGISPERVAQSLAEGLVLGAYRFTRYRKTKGPGLTRGELLARTPREARALAPWAARGARWAAAACRARDLANTSGDDLTPQGLAAEARKIAAASGARARVLDPRAMRALGMGAVLAVGRGSIHPPRFIVLERPPGGRTRTSRGAAKGPRTVVLIGKGITFDTGGISLKARDGMGRMKYDMSGAAAVLGVFAALPTLDLPFRVVGLIPSAENMPSAGALKPGDIVRMLDGAQVEVTNTDAEGRLVLADALAYARRYAPEVVVDLATLTGSIRLALGGHAAGLFTSDDALARALEAAATASGERLWRMPLWPEFGESLKSDVADLVNSAGPEGGASIAASFLARFAKGLRWAHLDIASTAWAFTDRPHEPRGPTGFGVRLLLEWLASQVR